MKRSGRRTSRCNSHIESTIALAVCSISVVTEIVVAVGLVAKENIILLSTPFVSDV